MDQTLVKDAARKAQLLSSVVEDRALRVGAFAVLFSRLLDAPQVPGGFGPAGPCSKSAGKGARPGRATKAGPIQRMRELVSDGFFKAPSSLKATMDELEMRGFGYDQATVGKNLQRLVRDRLLRRKRGKEGNRDIYVYSEW